MLKGTSYGIVLTVQNRYSAGFAGFNRGLKQTGVATDAFMSKMTRLQNSLGVFTGITAAAGAMMFQFKKMLDVSAEYEQIDVSIKSIVGSVERGQKLINDLRAFTLQNPLGFEATVDNAKRLLAVGTPVEKVMEDLKMLTGIASGVGLDKFFYLTKAYTDVKAAGQLYGQEALQFMNSSIGIYQLIADQRKVDLTKLKKDLKAGSTIISSAEVEQALRGLVSKGGIFYGLMEKQMTTFKGLMGQIRDSFYLMSVDFGAVLNEKYKPYAQQFLNITQKIRTLAETDYGKATFLYIVKAFEVTTIAAFAVTLTLVLRTFMMLASTALPATARALFIVRLQAGNTIGAIWVMAKSLAIGFATALWQVSLVVAGVYILHKALQAFVGQDYLRTFREGFMVFLEMVKNYDPTSKKSYINADTYHDMFKSSKGTLDNIELARKLFTVFKIVDTVFRGAATGIMLVFNALNGLFNLLSGNKNTTDGITNINFEAWAKFGKVLGVLFAANLLVRLVKFTYAFLRIGKIIGFVRTQLLALRAASAFTAGMRGLINFGTPKTKEPIKADIGKFTKKTQEARKKRERNMFSAFKPVIRERAKSALLANEKRGYARKHTKAFLASRNHQLPLNAPKVYADPMHALNKAFIAFNDKVKDFNRSTGRKFVGAFPKAARHANSMRVAFGRFGAVMNGVMGVFHKRVMLYIIAFAALVGLVILLIRKLKEMSNLEIFKSASGFLNPSGALGEWLGKRLIGDPSPKPPAPKPITPNPRLHPIEIDAEGGGIGHRGDPTRYPIYYNDKRSGADPLPELHWLMGGGGDVYDEMRRRQVKKSRLEAEEAERLRKEKERNSRPKYREPYIFGSGDKPIILQIDGHQLNGVLKGINQKTDNLSE